MFPQLPHTLICLSLEVISKKCWMTVSIGTLSSHWIQDLGRLTSPYLDSDTKWIENLERYALATMCSRHQPQSCIHIDLLVLRADSGIVRTAEIRPQSTSSCLCWLDIRLQRTRPMEECHPLGRYFTNTPCRGLDCSGFPRCPPSRLHFSGQGYKSYRV